MGGSARLDHGQMLRLRSAWKPKCPLFTAFHFPLPTSDFRFLVSDFCLPSSQLPSSSIMERSARLDHGQMLWLRSAWKPKRPLFTAFRFPLPTSYFRFLVFDFCLPSSELPSSTIMERSARLDHGQMLRLRSAWKPMCPLFTASRF